MDRASRAAAIAFFLFAATIAAPLHAVELPELAAQAKPAVVLLTVLDASGRKIGTGTGFFVSADGRLVTNQHVIDAGAAVRATLADGKELNVLGLLASDEARDIAILKTEGEGFPALRLGETKSVRAGDEIVVLGSPHGLSGTLSVGIVSALRENGASEMGERKEHGSSRYWGIQITAPVSPGSSGSPIMTRNGDVVGVAVGALNDAQNLNFGIRIEVVKELLAGLEAGAQPMPLTGVEKKGSTRNLAISGAVFAVLGLAYFLWGRGEARKERRSSKSERGQGLLS